MSSSYPTTCFLSFLLFLSLFIYPYLSFRILIIPVTFFSLPSASTERTRPKEEIIAFWHRGIASITSAVLEDHVYYILLHETMPLRKYVLKERYYTQIIMTRCFHGKILRFSLEWKVSLANTSAKQYRKFRNTFVEICSRCIEIYRKNLFPVAFIGHVSSVHSRAFQ